MDKWIRDFKGSDGGEREDDISYAKPCVIIDEPSMTLDVFGAVNLKLLYELKFALSLLEKKVRNRKSKNRRWVTLTVASRGGAAFAGLAAYDLIRSSGLLVKTVALGEVASAAVLIFLAGRKRAIHENSFLCVHEIGSFPKADLRKEVEITLDQVDRYNELYARIALQNSQMTESQYLRLRSREKYIMAKEAVRLGLAHSIIQNQ